MRQEEVRGVSQLVGEVLAVGTRRAAELHAAIVERVFSGVDRGTQGVATPIRLAHDGISTATYRGIGALLRAGGRSGGPPVASRMGAARWIGRGFSRGWK